MGEVWRARDTRLGREVALKVLPEEFVDDPERIARFQREAQLLATFNHPNIAAIHSFETVDGVRLLVMEMVPGDTVKQLLADGPLPLSRALAIARQVAEALDAAHGKGILHRDLKPANVKVTPEGKVKLLDFGLAKAFAPPPGATDLSETPTLDTDATRQGVILGTASYMSPEQARGKPLDWKSDVWSYGCLLFEMLSGRRAFQGESPSDTLVAILDKSPDWGALPLETPPRILDLIQGCLTKSREERTPDLAHARQVIDAVLEVRTAFAPPTGPSARIRRFPRAYAAAGSVLAVALAALLYFTLRGRDTKALPATKILAILPATDLTGRPDGRQLCDGVTFSLGVKLQNVPGLSITRPSDPSMLKETDPARWVRDTGANLLVQPALRQMGETRQLSFSMALAGSPIQIASGEVTGPAAEHFRLEDELVRKLTAALSIHLAERDRVPATATPSIASGAAQTDYLVALGYLERYDDPAQVRKAIDLLTQIPNGDDSALVQAALGRAYLIAYGGSKDVGMAGLAKNAAERSFSLDPDLPEAQVTLGEILAATGSPGKAVAVTRKALEKRPESPEALSALAYALERTGNIAEAEKAYLRVTELRPTAWVGFNKLGGFYFVRNEYERAADAYRKAISLNPDVAPVRSNLGAILVRLGRFDEALAEFRRSLAIKPTATAHSNVGTCLYLLGRYAEAAGSFEKAVALAPKNFRWSVYLGDALTFAPGREADARKAYAAALALGRDELRVDPSNQRTRVIVARCLARLGEEKQAWSETRMVVASTPDNSDILLPAAGNAAILGHRAEAIRWLETAVAEGLATGEIESNPDFSGLKGNPAFQALLKTPVPAPARPRSATGGGE
jgi:serine/threonine-protein kinase